MTARTSAPRLEHVNVTVSDPDRTAGLMQALFGWSVRWRGPALAAHLADVEGTDAVIAPAVPMPAATIAESDVGNSLEAEAVIQRITRFTRPINYLGLPSLAIPSGFTRSGLPVGMQIIGRSFDEAMLIRIGAAFQRATDYHQKVPKLP